jgi:aryl-alcohol dehydrogenase-like predicted oxidoreductase
MLPKRKLGKSGLEVSAIGLGCWGMTDNSYGTPDEQQAIATLHRALDLGITFFDTAEVYGPFKNEELLGGILSPHRNKIILATKFGTKIEGWRQTGLDSRPEHVKEAVDGSLLRLRTDHIDLLYQHRVDPAVPIEDTVGAMADLVQEGKARYLGLSEAGVNTIRRAHAVHSIAALQSEYSLWERNLEEQIIPVLRELGIGLVPFSPLGRGFLTGDVKRAEEYPEYDFRFNDPRFQGENFDANMRAASVVKEIASEKNATPGQIALAWLLARGDDIVPIPGTTRPAHLEENIKAISIILAEPETARLNNALDPTKVVGPRYNQQRMAWIDR